MSCGGEIVRYQCNRLLGKHRDGWRAGMVCNKGAGEKHAKRLWVTYSSLKTSCPAAPSEKMDLSSLSLNILITI